VRITSAVVIAMTLVAGGCASAPAGGTLGEGATARPRIAAVDSGYPPREASLQLDQAAYAAVFLVAPGHSATLLYPADSAVNNQLAQGTHRVQFEIPSLLAETDSQRLARIRDQQRNLPRTRAGTRRTISPIPPGTPTFLLLLTSPQPLVYQRMIDKTGGVSIPNIESEALNAVAKAIKSTISSEPREWSGYYQPVELRRYR
jgi:hypothetical protein